MAAIDYRSNPGPALKPVDQPGSFKFTPTMGTTEQTLIDLTADRPMRAVAMRLNLKALEDDGNTPNLVVTRYLTDNEGNEEDAETTTWTNGSDPTVLEIGDCWYNSRYRIAAALSGAVAADAEIIKDFGTVSR